MTTYTIGSDEDLVQFEARMTLLAARSWNPFKAAKARRTLREIKYMRLRAAQVAAASHVPPAIVPRYAPAPAPAPLRRSDDDDWGIASASLSSMMFDSSYDTGPSFDTSSSSDTFSGGGGDFGGGGSDSSW